MNELTEKTIAVFDNFCDGYEEEKKIYRSFEDKFNIQVRNTPLAHRLKNRVIYLSKYGIEDVRSGKKERAEQCFQESLDLMHEFVLLDLDLLPGLKNELWAEAGQEFVELVFVIMLYPVILNKEALPEKFPDPHDLYVNLPAYIAGIQDALGELSRLVDDFTLDNRLGLLQEYEIKERFILNATSIYNLLFSRFAGIPQNVINNSQRRNFRQTFKGRLDGLRDNIHRFKRDLVEISHRLVR